MSSVHDPGSFRYEAVEMDIDLSTHQIPKVDEITKSFNNCPPGPIEIPKSRRRFAVEPVETSQIKYRNGRRAGEKEHATTRSDQNDTGPAQNTNSSKLIAVKSTPRTLRKFTPQLIETAKRTRKAGDTAPAVPPSDRTEAVPGGDMYRSRKGGAARLIPPAPYNTPISETSQNPLFLEIKQAASPLLHRRSRPTARSQPSFRVPSLEPIASSESEASNPPSLSTSPSAGSDYSFMCKEPTRMRESVDDRFSGYLLELAARAAEKQLREQAMAAFPNDEHHEPVDHFIDRDTDESDSRLYASTDYGFTRRECAFTEVNWELISMRKHREMLEQQQKVEREKKARIAAELNRRRPSDSWRNPVITLFDDASNKNVIGGWQKDGELDMMRKGARPPMLGGDIEFPRCASPERARFDTTQKCQSLRSSKCSLDEQLTKAEKCGLWCGGKESPSQKSSACLWSSPNSRSTSRNGLWGGFCADTGAPAPGTAGPTGLLTPKIEIDNPTQVTETPHATPAASFTSGGVWPPTPPVSTPDMMSSIDEKLSAEIAIEDEFGDDFVTQVYNYLSLGYPSIARNFDEELSKISGIPLEELRQDDHLSDSRGYIRLGEDGNLRDSDITEESCIRWKALRLYVREWARQQPGMIIEEAAGVGMGNGVAARKGSWAV